MRKSFMSIVFAALACCGFVFTAQAASVSSRGVDIPYAGAAEVKTLADGDVVLIFTNTQEAGSFTLPKSAKVQVLAVGGGGAGGSLAAMDEFGMGSAGGGGAGGVSDHETILYPGDYTVTVGAGGARVQTIVQSWVGANGGNTTLALNGQPLVAGKGGGGGGSVKVNGRGESGGSGGGGSWYGDFTAAGKAVDGQGWAGAKAAGTDCGGGGGGAALAAADGAGRADGTPGAGRVLDITGEEVVYGRGGAGGRRAAGDAVAADGTGFGFGGAGANVTGRGGAGGDGVLVVRIHKLFDYTRVDKPEIPSFVWEEGQSYVAFDETTAAEPLKSAIAYVEGVTATNAAVVTVDGQVVTNGLGRFNYAIHLKDEYVWNDGTDAGSTKPFVAYWRVKEPNTIGEATVEVKKTVDWFEGANATLAIDVHSTPEKMRATPNVLVIGTLCGAHGLTSESVNTMLNTVSEVANVDWYFWNHVHTQGDVPYFSGSMKKGDPALTDTVYGLRQNNLNTANPSTTKLALEDGVYSNHGVAYGFYQTIAELLDSGKAADYDYILFSFDRSLAATYFRWPHPDEARVAKYLKNYYASDSVIWFIDHDGSDSDPRAGLSVTPWYPNILCYRSPQNGDYGWMTIGYYEYKLGTYTDKTTPYGYQAYRALMGLFDPAKYDWITEARYTEVLGADGASANNRSGTADQVRALAGDVNPNQVDYDNAQAIAELIRNVIKAKIATLHVEDHVYLSNGLKINRTTGYWTTNEVWSADDFETAKTRWTPLTPEQLTATDTEGVQVNIPGVKTEAWLKFNIDVTDTGTFRSSLNATYNEKTGLWEKDPNDGPVTATLQALGGERILSQAEATTAVAWSFPTYKITGTVVHGEGEIVLNGFVTNKLDVAAGCTPEVVFRGKGGYVLDYLEVDGQVIDDFDPDLYNWIFNEVGADHDIKVGFKPLFTVPYPTTGPATREYDGKPAQPTVTPPTFIPGYDYEWKATYSMESNGVYTVDGGEVNVVRDENGNVVSTNVYVRIWINQPGYEDGVVIDYWTGVDQATVTPRPITVKYDDYAQTSDTRKTGDFSSAIVSGSLVAGDTLVPNGGRCTDYPAKGGKTADTITAKGDVVVTTPGFDGNNYAVTVLPGDYYYPDLQLVANAPSITKVYDGQSYGTTVTMLHPQDPKTFNEMSGWTEADYRKDNKGSKYSHKRTRTVSTGTFSLTYSANGTDFTPENPTFTDVGTYTVTYRVAYEEHSWTETQTRTQNKDTAWGESIKSNVIDKKYDPYVGTATITILPRPVTVIAGNAEREYDGMELTQPAYTVSARTATAGFVDGEGIASASMTADSKQTLPGVHSNKINVDAVTFIDGTKLSNYAITYVDGQLKVTPNALQATAPKIEKVYDGTPTDPVAVTVVDSHGNPLPAGSYTITYRTSLNGTPSTTVPEPPTDAGEYPVFYTVDGGAGYGVVSGVTTIKVTPRTVTLQANDAEKAFDGTPLTETGFTVVQGGAGEAVGFVGDEGIASVTMTVASQRTDVGSTPNVIDVYDTEHWMPKPGTKVQNYVFEVLPGTLTVTPNLNLPPVLPKNPSKVKEPTYEGDAFQNPANPDYPGYSAWNDDPKNPWWTVLDPISPTTPVDPADPSKGCVTNFVGQTPTTLQPGEETRLRFEVVGDGEFKWSSLVTDKTPGANPPQILVVVDGKTNQVYSIEKNWTEHVLHVTDETDHDGATHTIEVVFVNDGDTGDATTFFDKVEFTPSATKPEMEQIVRTNPPTDAEETQKQIRIDNNPESGWMPVKDPETGKVVAVRSPDGNEGNSKTNDLDSTFTVQVTGTGELKVDKITTPIKPSTDPSNPNANTDNGQLTITVDGKTFKIPPESDETISYSIRTEGDTVIIENLVIKVTGEPDQNHVVVFEYTRDADDPTGNTASVITGIEWKTYGENGKGGSSWLQGKALWIIDHEDPGDGWVYLAFEPELKVEEELVSWVQRSDANNMIRVKYGETRAQADACTPVIAHLSDKPGHEVTPIKVWIKVSLNDLSQVTVVKPVGYWRIFIDGPAIKLSGTEDNTTGGGAKMMSTDPVDPNSPAQESDIIGEGAISVNTFGILKIERATTNTMIAVPWTWYSKIEREAENIPVKKLVKTTNLELGDMLYAPIDNDTYAAWVVEKKTVTVGGKTTTYNDWSAVQVVHVDGDGLGRMVIKSDEDEGETGYSKSTRIARGNGLWLVRQKPLDDAGNIRPFWVYGQSVTTPVTTVIPAPTGSETVHSTMIGNPYAKDIVLNDFFKDNVEGTIDSGDRIKIHTAEGVNHDLVYVKGKGWREYVTKVVDGVKKSGYTYQTVIPAGMAFWYDRRGKTDLIIKWPKPVEPQQ